MQKTSKINNKKPLVLFTVPFFKKLKFPEGRAMLIPLAFSQFELASGISSFSFSEGLKGTSPVLVKTREEPDDLEVP